MSSDTPVAVTAVQLIRRRRKQREASAQRATRRLQEITTKCTPTVPQVIQLLRSSIPEPKAGPARVAVPLMKPAACLPPITSPISIPVKSGARRPVRGLRRTQSEVVTSKKSYHPRSKGPDRPAKLRQRGGLRSTREKQGPALRASASVRTFPSRGHSTRMPQLQHTMSGRFSSIWKSKAGASSSRELTVSPIKRFDHTSVGTARDGGPSLPVVPLGNAKAAHGTGADVEDINVISSRRWKPEISEYHVSSRASALPGIRGASSSQLTSALKGSPDRKRNHRLGLSHTVGFGTRSNIEYVLNVLASRILLIVSVSRSTTRASKTTRGGLYGASRSGRGHPDNDDIKVGTNADAPVTVVLAPEFRRQRMVFGKEPADSTILNDVLTLASVAGGGTGNHGLGSFLGEVKTQEAARAFAPAHRAENTTMLESIKVRCRSTLSVLVKL